VLNAVFYRETASTGNTLLRGLATEFTPFFLHPVNFSEIMHGIIAKEKNQQLIRKNR